MGALGGAPRTRPAVGAPRGRHGGARRRCGDPALHRVAGPPGLAAVPEAVVRAVAAWDGGDGLAAGYLVREGDVLRYDVGAPARGQGPSVVKVHTDDPNLCFTITAASGRREADSDVAPHAEDGAPGRSRRRFVGGRPGRRQGPARRDRPHEIERLVQPSLSAPSLGADGSARFRRGGGRVRQRSHLAVRLHIGRELLRRDFTRTLYHFNRRKRTWAAFATASSGRSGTVVAGGGGGPGWPRRSPLKTRVSRPRPRCPF